MNLSRLRNKCDRLWTEILLKEKPFCEVCGDKSVQIHHFFPKSMSASLRYSMDNGIALCMGCHLKHHTGNPTIQAIIIQDRGQVWYNNLSAQRQIIKVNKGYYERILKELENLATPSD